MYRYLVLILFFVSCNSTKKLPENPKETHNVSFKILEKGGHSGITEPVNMIWRNSKEINEFHKKNGIPKNEFAIDFNKSVLGGIFLGQQSTGGFTIKIDKIIESDDSLKVYYSVQTGKIAIMVITQPYVIFMMPKTNKPVEFILLK